MNFHLNIIYQHFPVFFLADNKFTYKFQIIGRENAIIFDISIQNHLQSWQVQKELVNKSYNIGKRS